VNLPPKMTKDIILTGASGAIGSTMARHLAAAGFSMHLTSRDPGRLKNLVAEISKYKTGVHSYALDLLDLKQGREVAETFFRKAAHPFGLICNAGDLGLLGPFLDCRFEDWAKSLQQNFVAHAAMIHAFGRNFRATGRKGGSIVILSGAGLGGAIGHANLSSYGTAKAALTYLAEALSLEFRELEININAIAPGQVKSGITEQALRAGVERVGAYAESAQKCMETGGVSPDLAAELVTFLMSPAAKGISGRLLSARFDQKRLRKQTKQIAGDPHLYRLRRIDDELFSPGPGEKPA
jgi:NAD(P)-dependent dehydrogenase (short-subunit alcohol dehydrogenase family)